MFLLFIFFLLDNFKFDFIDLFDILLIFFEFVI